MTSRLRVLWWQLREVGGAAPVEDYRLTRYGAGARAVGGDLVNSAMTKR